LAYFVRRQLLFGVHLQLQTAVEGGLVAEAREARILPRFAFRTFNCEFTSLQPGFAILDRLTRADQSNAELSHTAIVPSEVVRAVLCQTKLRVWIKPAMTKKEVWLR
jgi:hypothetical protein